MNVATYSLMIDECRDRGGCDIAESRLSVTVSGLTAEDARFVIQGASELYLNWTGLDASDSKVEAGELADDLAPYRLVIMKPAAPEDVLYVLSKRGFEQLLDAPVEVGVWRVAGLTFEFVTGCSTFTDWTSSTIEDTAAITPLKNPRNLVREYGDARKIPADLRPWLLRNICWEDNDPIFRIWASKAARASLFAIVDELDSEPASVVLRGPPKRTVPLPVEGLLELLGQSGFEGLQKAATWVYEMPGETEMRHPLMSAELSRLFMDPSAGIELLATSIQHVIDGAKTAYQLGMSKLSSDTLKMLTDLRKSVLDEASKVGDATRQLVAAVATTLSVGVGLVAARIAAGADGRLIGSVTVVISAYIFAVIWAGHRAIKLQNDVRGQWKGRTYGFMSDADYRQLVDGPASKASDLFYSVAWTASFLVLALFVAVVWVISIPAV